MKQIIILTITLFAFVVAPAQKEIEYYNKGSEAAASANYPEAIRLFSKAIEENKQVK